VDCAVPAEGAGVLVPLLIEALERQGITDPAALTVAEQRLRAVAGRGCILAGVPILEGRAPVPPQDESVAWERDFFQEGYAIDPETGVIDYRERIARNSVVEGERLARVIPGQPGVDGVSLFGEPIPAAAPAPLRLHAGKNVRFDADEQAFYASGCGRIRVSDTEICVDDVLTIEGSIGLKSGNVRHPGMLIITENIESGSRVEASGDIEVHGYVEDAVIDCGGNLIVHGGITGGSGSRVRCGGSVQAKFLLNTTVEAMGDIVIGREIDNSVIRARGAVRVPKGRIVAGEVVALGGIEAAHAGTAAGIPTLLIAGEDFALPAQIREKRLEMDGLKTTLGKVRAQLEPVAGQEHRLSPASRQALNMLRLKLSQAEEKIRATDAQIQEFCEQSARRAVDRVLVRVCIHPDVSFRIKQRVLHCRETVNGPVSILVRNGDVGVFTASPSQEST